ncbi:hypothetical protein VTK73DRAFT_6577 [Phialemonium thermophilum]|uniref:Uncharacterized protein n=1 Tax=Phialemonium thermophilum TaxID=223376 RepID=A0ABR3WJH7_9PEZI
MAPSKNELESIAYQAEQDLNTYQAKTGNARGNDIGEAGVDTRTEKKFPGSEVRYHPDMSTNAGYDRRIPPEEGGDVDDRGRQTRGRHFEGPGGPEDKIAQRQQNYGGYNDRDVEPGNVEFEGQGPRRDDPLSQGAEAARANVGSNPPGPGGSKFRGADYYTPEDVPDSVAAEGYIPPESVTQSSREAEQY